MHQLAQAKLSQAPTESTQPTTGGDPVQALFEKQRAYFATDVTKTYEWRIDRLDRLSPHTRSQMILSTCFLPLRITRID
ncbi:MAG: hypothetical protein JOZ08_25320 [Verrucomicrobia bacterium]|nr:hypothetical protein [Verrucomicrobiota bacterium]